jgi:hypothetical protein
VGLPSDHRARGPALRTPSRDLAERTEIAEPAERIEPALRNDPTARKEPNDPTERTESADPTEPIESTELVELIERNELVELIDQRERVSGTSGTGSSCPLTEQGAQGVTSGWPSGRTTYQRPPALVSA